MIGLISTVEPFPLETNKCDDNYDDHTDMLSTDKFHGSISTTRTAITTTTNGSGSSSTSSLTPSSDNSSTTSGSEEFDMDENEAIDAAVVVDDESSDDHHENHFVPDVVEERNDVISSTQVPSIPATTIQKMIPGKKSSSSILIHSMEESRKKRLVRLRRRITGTHSQSKIETNVTAVPNLTEKEQLQPNQQLVQFTTVTIRDYPREIGDNPASMAGPSISIGWKHFDECTIDVELYEEARGQRRYGREMIIPSNIREDMLRKIGYSRSEIVACIRELNLIRGQRRRTYETLHLQSIQAAVESLQRKTLNVLTFGKYKRNKERTVTISSKKISKGID